MKLPLAYYGNPVLRKKCPLVNKITPEIHQLVKDMEETMHAHDGIGLAAPQVSQSIALFLTYVPLENNVAGGDEGDVAQDNPGVLRVFINPKIIEYSDEAWIRGEGCLSIPGIYGPVIRPMKIKVQAMDLEGKIFVEEFEGLQARAIMHENDHINGVLFIDRVQGKDRQELEHPLRELKKKLQKK